MSTKCTVLSGHNKKRKIDYHFYYDYADDKHHLDINNIFSYQAFLDRVGKLLSACPKSDAGIYMINMETGKAGRMAGPKCCCKRGGK